MGCLSSKAQDPIINSSKHGSRRGDPSVKVEPPTPDFAISSHYKVLHMLGEGGSGETWLCKNLRTNEEVAVKYIQRPIPKVVLPMIYHEVKIQAQLGEGHVNLVQAKELVLSKTHLALGLEYVSGGNLTAYVMNKFESTGLRNGMYMSESEAQYFFKQFLSAVEYLHTNHVAHRDLKLDNIVLDNSTPPRIKLCDFGFAKDWDEQSNMFTQIGTPVYMSPQVISSKNSKQGYDAQKADVWACGVLLFVMLLGMFPFEHAEHPDPNSSDAHVEVWLQQIKCSWRENPRIAQYATKLSEPCRDLLDKIFEMDEAKRISIKEIREHPWYTHPLPHAFQTALSSLELEQQAISARMHAGEYQSTARDTALHKIVDRAGTLPTSNDLPDLARVTLGRIPGDSAGIDVEVLEGGPDLHVLEEGEEGELSSSHTGGPLDLQVKA
mmetsp:Transcript_4620/g.7936  ORF Transcript_4620/g.7936 Transcript_4620/m.7936 type:complete len:437 (+) Transcript_4620:190-1500(+)